jgi:hypothetical protein
MPIDAHDGGGAAPRNPGNEPMAKASWAQTYKALDRFNGGRKTGCRNWVAYYILQPTLDTAWKLSRPLRW